MIADRDGARRFHDRITNSTAFTGEGDELSNGGRATRMYVISDIITS